VVEADFGARRSLQNLYLEIFRTLVDKAF